MKYLQAEQIHSQAGSHYDPWRKARLADGRLVWITRQDGDGKTAFFYTEKNEVIAADEWISPGPGAPVGNKNAAKEITAKNFSLKFYPQDHRTLDALLEANYASNKTKCIRKALQEASERERKKSDK